MGGGGGAGGGGYIFQGSGEIQLPQTPHLVDVVVDEVEQLAVVHDADVAGVLAEDLGGEVGAGHQQQLQCALPVVEDGPVDGRGVAAEGKGDKHCRVDRRRGSGNGLGLGVGAWGGGHWIVDGWCPDHQHSLVINQVQTTTLTCHQQVQTTTTLTCH